MWWLDYAAEFRDEPGYLRVTARGRYSLSRSRRLLARAGREVQRRRPRSVLVDLSGVPQPVPDAERIELGRLAARTYAGLPVAIVDPVEAADRGIEAVAHNGGANLRIFGSQAAALAWLHSH